MMHTYHKITYLSGYPTNFRLDCFITHFSTFIIIQTDVSFVAKSSQLAADAHYSLTAILKYHFNLRLSLSNHAIEAQHSISYR